MRRRRLRPALCATVTNLLPIPRRLQAAREAVVDPVVLTSVKARPVSLPDVFWHSRQEPRAAALPRGRSCIDFHTDLRLSEQLHRYPFRSRPDDMPVRCPNARFLRFEGRKQWNVVRSALLDAPAPELRTGQPEPPSVPGRFVRNVGACP